MEEVRYIFNEGEKTINKPSSPNPKDYYDILETAEERAERIYLYSEVKDVE